jgi:hypothetical protein
MQDTVPAPTETITTRVTRTLDELGHSADDVADRLRALGIKGQALAHCCPIANLLRQLDCVISVDVLEIFAGVLGDDGRDIQVDVPEAVSTFIARFDAGVYLDLVEVTA